MNDAKTILIVGTYDTKQDELSFIKECILQGGGQVLCMDVSVLGEPQSATDYSKQDVALAASASIESIIETGDENTAMQMMAVSYTHLTLPTIYSV